jgi:AcrR family transcriptional regulator
VTLITKARPADGPTELPLVRPLVRQAKPGKPPKPLRADAQRNRERILEAAAEVFADRGLDATLHDVAERAEVGVGTVYRRFPDKEALIEALFEDKVNQLIELAEHASAQPDAWTALIDFMRAIGEQQAQNRGLHEVLHGGGYGQDRVAAARNRMMPLIDNILRRAQEQGSARPDVEPADLTVLMLMLSSLAIYTQDAQPDAWRRYLELLIDGLRAHPGLQPPSVPALSDTELLCAMSNWHQKRRG